MKWTMIRRIGAVLFFMGAMLFGQGHSDIISICNATGIQVIIQAVYDSNHDQYLVVWEDERSGVNADIYGQFIDADGTLIGGNFPICTAKEDQYWPHLDFDPNENRFLVVFKDYRKGEHNGDIRGVLLDTQGNFIDAPTSFPDHSFGICTHDSSLYTCSVAFNYLENIYLVVWGDYRNKNAVTTWGGIDVYGQLVAADGTLLPAAPKTNFAIANFNDWEENVADVTYNEIINEFFVGYGTDRGLVRGQRINHMGQLIWPDGTAVLAKPTAQQMDLPAMTISMPFQNGPDCLQTKVCSRTEYFKGLLKKPSGAAETEIQVVWKGQISDTYNDVWGQRIGFFWEDNKWVARYVELGGDTALVPCNFPISVQPGMVGPPEVAYSSYDDEYLVAWGDPRKGGYSDEDLYAQRLWINPSDCMIFYADDRVDTVTFTENIPVDTTRKNEGGIIGVAHNSKTNEFLVAYQINEEMTASDIVARIFYGSEPSGVDNTLVHPDRFSVRSNYPNPFNPNTMISFDLSGISHVRIRVFDITGRLIAALADAELPAGSHAVEWDGKSLTGQDAASGVYLYSIETDFGTGTEKMMLIR